MPIVCFRMRKTTKIYSIISICNTVLTMIVNFYISLEKRAKIAINLQQYDLASQNFARRRRT